ncbi:hypothetical protein H6F86_21530 [Phormidium sp. FACHB-592]|uniref:Helix-turn-helix type 11 domain-containing protein n=1 Tax=Stenomitos frigidus AS-A4 TaxID=2933935 RepID=A0ABV0KF27_9CYAN|nr:hypothetical protein [Phormidium sp. FACHB-592]MBD2076417.1 hypothetical protein [Phormidium sp. FACHB-592]
MNWQTPIPSTAAYRRAGGRRKINAERQADRYSRQHQMLTLLKSYFELGGKMSDRGLKAQLAEKMSLARSTISKYWKSLKRTIDWLEASISKNWASLRFSGDGSFECRVG